MPERNKSGRRVYSDADIQRLSMLAELCSLGHSIGQVANWSDEQLQQNLKKLGKIEQLSAGKSQNPVGQNFVDTKESLDNLLLALKLYKLDVISHEFNKLKLLLSPRQLALDILTPLLKEVGEAVIKGDLRLSQEQALISLIRFHVGSVLYRQVEHKSKKSAEILLTSPEGDYNEIGLMLSALLCAHYNLNFYYLGPNLPLSSVLDTVHSISITDVIIGSDPKLHDRQMNYLVQYLEMLLHKLGSNQSVVLRGASSKSDLKFSKDKRFHHAKSLYDLDHYLKNF